MSLYHVAGGKGARGAKEMSRILQRCSQHSWGGCASTRRARIMACGCRGEEDEQVKTSRFGFLSQA